MEGPPSWVQDWSAGCVNPFYSPEGRITYRTSGETRQNTRANESPGILVFAGYRVDKITAVGSILDFQDQHARTSILEKRRSEDDAGIMAKDGSKDPYRDGEPFSEALWRTFIGDRTRTEQPAPASSKRPYQAHRENDKIGLTTFLNTKGSKCSKGRSRELWAEYNDYYVDGSDVRKSLWAFWSDVFQSDGIDISRRMFQKMLNECLIQHVEELAKFDKDIWEYSFIQSLHCPKRKFCVTEKGYIGLVPPATETGDRVCVFSGAQVPFLIRHIASSDETSERQAVQYTLVGECYIHGVMDGELVANGAKVEDFVLCWTTARTVEVGWIDRRCYFLDFLSVVLHDIFIYIHFLSPGPLDQ